MDKNPSDDPLLFNNHEVLMPFSGIPQLLDLHRNGNPVMLQALDNGQLSYLEPNTESGQHFYPTGTPLMCADGPIESYGPIFPTIVDWNGTGKSDLLIGDANGHILLYRDIGEEKVEYARGVRLLDNTGFLKFEGTPCPTLVRNKGERHLFVAEENGSVWKWPLVETESYVTNNIINVSGAKTNYEKGHWWKLEDKKGTLLAAGPEEPILITKQDKIDCKVIQFDPIAPVLEITPPIGGSCDVHITFRQPERYHKELQKDEFNLDHTTAPILKIKTSDEEFFQMISTQEFHTKLKQTVYWKNVDLTDKTILLQQLKGAVRQEGGLPVYIESIQITPIEKTSISSPVRKKICVSGIDDAPDWYLNFSNNTAEEIDERVEQHVQSGFNLIYFKLGGGCWEYKSRVSGAELAIPDLGQSESKLGFIKKRIESHHLINRVELTAQSCHKRNMKCYGWLRLQNHGERLKGGGPVDQFWIDYPEFYEKDPQGNVVKGKMCIAYPEVIDFHIKIVEEAMDMGCDGIMMDTLRALPKVAYGDPVLKEFKERYGLDMRKFLPSDKRVKQLQSDIFARFLKKIREAMKAKKADSELHLRICQTYELMGVNPQQYAEQGLIDEIIIEDRLVPKRPDIEGLVKTTRNSSCAATGIFGRPKWGSHKLRLDPYIIDTESDAWLKIGSKGISFYETAHICQMTEFSRAIRRINDPNDLPSRLC